MSWETDYEQDSFSLCHSAVANGRPAVGQDVRYNFDKAADFFRSSRRMCGSQSRMQRRLMTLPTSRSSRHWIQRWHRKVLPRSRAKTPIFSSVNKWLSEANNNLLYCSSGWGYGPGFGTVADGMGRVAGSQLDKRRQSTPANSM